MRKSVLLISVLIFTHINSYGALTKQSSMVGQELASQIRMSVKIATCLPATIDNIAFGALDSATVLSGEIAGHTTLSLDCSGTIVPQRVSLLFEPATPHLTMGASGYIGSVNNTLGYLVAWEDSQVGDIDAGVPMGKELLLKKPTASLMKVKLKVKPIALPIGSNSVTLGSGSTHITIKIKYL
ncbi:TPA: fimbrial protein [Providencia alcalifaciens]